MLEYNKTINIKTDVATEYQYFIDKEHPLATGNSGRVYLHRHLASIFIGRWLSKEEHVHHIDGNKSNNVVSNLRVLSAEEHGRLHTKGTILEYKICPVCNIEFKQKESSQVYCSVACVNIYQKHNSIPKNKEVTKELLDKLIPVYSWTVLGRLLGYSDVGIKKRAIALGCDITKAKYYRNKGTVAQR